MKLHKLVGVEDVFLGLEATDVGGALEAIAERLAERLDIGADALVAGLLERERLGSTSVGDEFAIPHCKMSGIRKIHVSLARFAEGVDFQAPDGRPARFLFVVLSPPDQPAAHLQTLSQIARVLKRADLRRELLDAADAEAVVEIIRRTAESEGL